MYTKGADKSKNIIIKPPGDSADNLDRYIWPSIP